MRCRPERRSLKSSRIEQGGSNFFALNRGFGPWQEFGKIFCKWQSTKPTTYKKILWGVGGKRGGITVSRMSKEQEKRLSDLASSSIVGGDIAAVLAEVQELRALETKAAAPVWTACADSLPDSDTTVMTYAPDSAEPVWPGYHDGEEWVDMLGAPITDAVVTHWMHFPEPPSSLARALAEVPV